MKKRILAMLLCLAMLASLAACGLGQTEAAACEHNYTQGQNGMIYCTKCGDVQYEGTSTTEAPAAVTPAAETMPEPVVETAAEPTPAPEPQSYELTADCVVPVATAAVSKDYTLKVNGEETKAFYFDWIAASGNIDAGDQPDRVFYALRDCVLTLPFAEPADFVYTDVTLSDGIVKFAAGTYVAAWLVELPGLSSTELLNLTVIPECTASYVEFLPDYNGKDNVCFIGVRFDVPEHVHELYYRTTKEATCTENGEKVWKCDCGYTYTETLPALGHSWSGWSYDNSIHWRDCSRCGLHESASHIMDDSQAANNGVHFCTVCGYRIVIIY